MSYSLFHSELYSKLGKQHTDTTKFARTIAQGYNNLMGRFFEILTGGGMFPAISAGLPGLISGFQAEFTKNLNQHKDVNLFNQMAPYIQTYWAGQMAIGPTGQVVITYTGNFKGPIIPQNTDLNIFISTLIGVISTHLLTLSGMYTNYYTGATSPWSGALLQTFP